MNVRDLTPPTPGSIASWDDVAGLQAKLIEAIDQMTFMAADVGLAKHVLEYNSDQKKRALARAMAPALAGGDSAAKAEAEARASDGYERELTLLGKAHAAAEQTMTAWEVAKLRWDTARSLLSLQRETVKHL